MERSMILNVTCLITPGPLSTVPVTADGGR